MSKSKARTTCLHCGKALVQKTGPGRKYIYCSQHSSAESRRVETLDQIALQLDYIENSINMIEQEGPVEQPLPEIAVWDVRDGIPMRVV